MLFVFDLDGVLLDTNEMIKDSYRQAGALPPDDVLGSEGTGWLEAQFGVTEAQNIRARKSQLYLDSIAQQIPDILPPFIVAQWLYASGHKLWMLTAAPPGTAELFTRYYVKKPRMFETVIDNIRITDKMAFIRAHASITGVYIDDQRRSEVDCCLPDQWRFVQYSGEDEDKFASLLLDE